MAGGKQWNIIYYVHAVEKKAGVNVTLGHELLTQTLKPSPSSNLTLVCRTATLKPKST